MDNKGKKVLIFDLDGTLRKSKSGSQFINIPEDQEPIPEAIELVRGYSESGWEIYGCTNQLGVKQGFKTIEDCVKEQIRTLNLFEDMRAIYFCPDLGETVCTVDRHERLNKTVRGEAIFRKPSPGMIFQILSDIFFEKLITKNFTQLLSRIKFIGDLESDRLAAAEAGIEFEWAIDALTAVRQEQTPT